MKKIFGFVATALIFAGCSSSNDEIPTPQPEKKVIKVTAKLPEKGSTRVEYAESGDYINATWESTDQIRCTYLASSIAQKQLTTDGDRTISANTLTFNLSGVPDTDSYLYAWYPTWDISDIATNATASTCKLQFTSVPTGIYASLSDIKDKNCFVGCAKYTSTSSQTGMQVGFYNIFTLLKINVKVPTTYSPTSLAKIELKQSGGGNLRTITQKSGSETYVTVTGGDTPSFAWTNLGGSRYVKSLNISLEDILGDSDYKLATFYALLPPHLSGSGHALAGIRITVQDNNGYTYTYSSGTDKKELEAGKWYIINAKLAYTATPIS